MCRERILRRADGPDVQVVYLDDTRVGEQETLYLFPVDVGRNTVERKAQAVVQQVPGRVEYDNGNDETYNRVMIYQPV